SSEYRVHVIDGKVVRLFKKLKDDEVEEEDYPIRNLSKGYHFSLRDIRNNNKIEQLVSRLHPLLEGGIFYGMDIGYIREQGDFFIFELNSACGLNDNTAIIYAEKFSEILPLP
ncbi:MAG TPA: hypothetical protein PLC53_03645, partial [Bacilli bacterium]|nr:hypothetical protein [Bacilli bacterium]